MIMRLLPVLVVVLSLAGGCQNQKRQSDAQTPPPSVDMARVAEVRSLYQEVNAGTRVGYINAVLPSDRLVSVADVPTADFAVGDAVTFVDLDQNPIASGRVVNVLEDAVHVQYTETQRAPIVGDLAVKFVR